MRIRSIGIFTFLLIGALFVSPASAESWISYTPEGWTLLHDNADADDTVWLGNWTGGEYGVGAAIGRTDPVLFNPSEDNPGYVIFHTETELDANEGFDFTLRLIDGTTIPGSVTVNWAWPYTETTLVLGSSTFYENGLFPLDVTSDLDRKYRIYPAYHEENDEYAFILQEHNLLEKNRYVKFPVSNAREIPIYSFYLEPTAGDCGATVWIGDYDTYINAEEYDIWKSAQAAASFATKFVSTVWFIANGITYWFYFIFIENFFLTIVLYEGVVLVLAANESKDIFRFFKNAWRYQTKLFEFLMWFFNAILQIVYFVKSIIWPI